MRDARPLADARLGADGRPDADSDGGANPDGSSGLDGGMDVVEISDAPPEAAPITYCDASGCDWTQWAHDSTHSGSTGAIGQAPSKLLAQIVFDPFLTQEQAESQGDLLAHFQSPLLVGDDMYMVTKEGQYISCNPPGSGQLGDGGTACGPAAWNRQMWCEKHFHWESGQLVEKWSFMSDWKPEPSQMASGWEPVFQPAVFGSYLYVPGAGGGLWKVDRMTGAVVTHIQPFGGTIDPSTYVAGPLTVDANGDILYNAIRLDPANPFDDATGWLVKVTSADVATRATYASLVPDAPRPTDACDSYFSADAGSAYPYPPPSSDAGAAVAPHVACLSQRPGLNVAPAVGADGTIITLSRAHGDSYYSYLVAVNPDLTPKWDTSLRGRIDDGCGVLVPSQAVELPDGSSAGYGCRRGAAIGVDPRTNEKPAPWVDDSSSSTPVVLPDGSVVYGALTDYNNYRGHLMHFDANGEFLASFDFGWDVTPAVYTHDGTYSVVLKDNHYFNWGTNLPGPYGITRLDSHMKIEWNYLNTNTNSCVRNPNDAVTCTNDHPESFEWCVNAPAIDGKGLVYANSEDGNLYVVNQDGGMVSRTFLELALGAAYTPIALDSQGRIYALNGGTMRVLGQ